MIDCYRTLTASLSLLANGDMALAYTTPRLGAVDDANYQAIGEADNFQLKFRRIALKLRRSTWPARQVVELPASWCPTHNVGKPSGRVARRSAEPRRVGEGCLCAESAMNGSGAAENSGHVSSTVEHSQYECAFIEGLEDDQVVAGRADPGSCRPSQDEPRSDAVRRQSPHSVAVSLE
jgi:hypothetical protein